MTKMLVNFDKTHMGTILGIAPDIAGFYYYDEFSIIKEFTTQSKAAGPFMLSLMMNDFIQSFSHLDQDHDSFLDFFDYIKLEIPFNDWRDSLVSIEKLARKKSIIAQINGFEKLSDLLPLLPHLASKGIYGVMLAPDQNEGKLSGQFSIVDMGIFIEQCHKNGLAACLIGGIEAPDIPRFLPYSPDILCFNIDQFLIEGEFNKQQSNLIRSLIPREKEDLDYTTSASLGTDRILVNNFVLAMAIGAYNHERNRLQKVRFSVAADVLRLSVNPEDMRHIFSYDLIIDGIKRLALLGHVELVETLAERIAAFILSYPRVQKVIVRVEKLELEPESVGIEIERVKRPH